MNIFISKTGESLLNKQLCDFFLDKDVTIYNTDLKQKFKNTSRLFNIDSLEKEINRADLIIIFLSDIYLKDEWLMAELHALYMLEQSRNTSILIPVLIGKIQDTQIPIYFREQQTELVDIRNVDEGVRASKIAEVILKRNQVHKKIFIGHGNSKIWFELKDFVENRLHLPYDEFNRESAAGKTTTDRLLNMLDNACFAFLVMTAEDEHSDKSKHARENVIHELGLFQGRLRFEKAIVLLEEGCSEFSNIAGLNQIRFSNGNMKAAFEAIREVLERERIILKTS